MKANKLFIPILILILALVIVGCQNNSDKRPAKSQNIAEVTNVRLDVLESLPLQLSIRAKGKVSSSGWTNPELSIYVYETPPKDGIYEFDFKAVPPSGPSTTVMTPIKATYKLNPLPDNLKGVRIHAAQNTKVALLNQGTPSSAVFEFKGPDPNDRFVIKLVEPEKIQHARNILSDTTRENKAVKGIIVKQKADYNPNWSYHLKPETIEFFSMAIELCDANMRHVEERLDEVGGSYLPNNLWCPWGSELVREIM